MNVGLSWADNSLGVTFGSGTDTITVEWVDGGERVSSCIPADILSSVRGTESMVSRPKILELEMQRIVI